MEKVIVPYAARFSRKVAREVSLGCSAAGRTGCNTSRERGYAGALPPGFLAARSRSTTTGLAGRWSGSDAMVINEDIKALAKLAYELAQLPEGERAARKWEAVSLCGQIIRTATPAGLAAAQAALEARWGDKIRAQGLAALVDPWWYLRADDGQPPVIAGLIESAMTNPEHLLELLAQVFSRRGAALCCSSWCWRSAWPRARASASVASASSPAASTCVGISRDTRPRRRGPSYRPDRRRCRRRRWLHWERQRRGGGRRRTTRGPSHTYRWSRGSMP